MKPEDEIEQTKESPTVPAPPPYRDADEIKTYRMDISEIVKDLAIKDQAIEKKPWHPVRRRRQLIEPMPTRPEKKQESVVSAPTPVSVKPPEPPPAPKPPLNPDLAITALRIKFKVTIESRTESWAEIPFQTDLAYGALEGYRVMSHRHLKDFLKHVKDVTEKAFLEHHEVNRNQAVATALLLPDSAPEHVPEETEPILTDAPAPFEDDLVGLPDVGPLLKTENTPNP